MNRSSRSILIALQLVAVSVAVAQTASRPMTHPRTPLVLPTGQRPALPTARPEIVLTAHLLDFGSVPVGSVTELSFMVQNVGDGVLTGAADVRAPFSIVEGGSYVLERPQAQLITVQYAPKSVGMHMTVVHLADGATVTVTGSATPHAAPAHRRSPAGSSQVRMIARR